MTILWRVVLGAALSFFLALYKMVGSMGAGNEDAEARLGGSLIG
jgi:hypothetical protein